MSGALDPTGIVSHPDEFHNGQAWKRPCRVATTANITIATALNAGDTIDGVTLAAGDRVLVKDQSTGSQNGIYVAGVTPIRDFDMDQDGTTNDFDVEEIAGAFVYVIAGTANAAKVFHTTNVAGGVLGSTAIVWAEWAGTTSIALDDLTDVTLTSPVLADRLRFDGSIWRNSALVWVPMTAFDGTNWLPFVDGSGNVIMVET